jgi:hypothetical protein
VNPALISGLKGPWGIAVVATVPEPSSLTLTLLGLVLAGLWYCAGSVNVPANLWSVGGRNPNREALCLQGARLWHNCALH